MREKQNTFPKTRPNTAAARPVPQSVAKSLRESFARFFEDPSRDKLNQLLKGSGGEFRNLDFKQTWPERSALAKQVLALDNIGGGVLIIGVGEMADGSLEATGLTAFVDKADVTQMLKPFLPSPLLDAVAVHDFDYPAGEYGVIQGKKFQAMFVEPSDEHTPFVSLRDGDKIAQGDIYIRRDGLVDKANYDEVHKLINQRIDSGYSTQSELDLRQHLDQLKVLFGEISRFRQFSGIGENLNALLAAMNQPNPLYPEEDYEAFIAAQIRLKKVKIRLLLETDRD